MFSIKNQIFYLFNICYTHILYELYESQITNLSSIYFGTLNLCYFNLLITCFIVYVFEIDCLF